MWRRGFIGPSDYNNYVRVVFDGLVIFSPDGSKVEPKVAQGWENSADFKVWTIQLRKGAKWSDGQPMTADDILFWYNDVLLNKDLTPSLPKWMKNADGSVAKVEKDGDFAVKFTYTEPNTLFLYELANKDGGDRTYAPFLPAHYLKQFHPTYAKQADIDKMVADAKFKTWTELFATKNAPFENPDRPTMAAWVPVTRISEQIFSMKRNPYFVGVDTEGNQPAHIDEVRFTFFADINTLNLAAIAGELDRARSPHQPDELSGVQGKRAGGQVQGHHLAGLRWLGCRGHVQPDLSERRRPGRPDAQRISASRCRMRPIASRFKKDRSWVWASRAMPWPRRGIRTIRAMPSPTSTPSSSRTKPTRCWMRSAWTRRSRRWLSSVQGHR